MPNSGKIGHFNLLEEIGHGGMGTVFRAFDPSLNREVAIKVLRQDLAKDPKFLTDFLQEARAAASISHPHIVQIHFVGEDGGQYYIVMELLTGRTLREIIEKDGPMNEERALDLTIEVTEALRAAYKNQMIHGDIKPANIMVADEVGAKVLDFGLAKLANVEVTEAKEIWGSPYYISPERVGQRAEDFRSDVYSLGATLFHVLTGRPPFDAETPEDLAAKRLNEKPPLLRDLDPNFTTKTEQVVNKMLNKSILLRYRDYDALLEDLKDAKTEATAKRLGVDLHPERFQPPEPPPPPPPPRSPVPLVIGGAIAVIIIAVLAYRYWPHHPPEPTPSPATNVVQQPEVPPPQPKPLPGTRKVEFSIKAPGATQVFLAGQFNNWDSTATPMRKETNGEWIATMQLPPGKHQYKYVVDGKWIPDPDNPDRVDDDRGGFNSVVTVTPSAPQPPKPATQPPPPSNGPGRVVDMTFTYKAPTASSVYLRGDFNNWSATATPMKKAANGEWTVTVPLKTGRHAYKFLVDGKMILDPDNSQTVTNGTYVDSIVDVGN
ncbi:MAG TPA: protein kinase [Verrucomicrobiae bacterium]|nr:protein kinase [Verrucomicrobiae bacterium]